MQIQLSHKSPQVRNNKTRYTVPSIYILPRYWIYAWIDGIIRWLRLTGAGTLFCIIRKMILYQFDCIHIWIEFRTDSLTDYSTTASIIVSSYETLHNTNNNTSVILLSPIIKYKSETNYTDLKEHTVASCNKP